MSRLRARLSAERGSALVEFVFVALLVFVPLVYVVAGFSAVQRGVFASTAAAREAGRAMGTAPDPVTGHARALRAAQLAVEDQHVDAPAGDSLTDPANVEIEETVVAGSDDGSRCLFRALQAQTAAAVRQSRSL